MFHVKLRSDQSLDMCKTCDVWAIAFARQALRWTWGIAWTRVYRAADY